MALEMHPNRLNEELARLGKALIAQLFVLFKTSFNYSEGHAAIDQPISNLLKVVQEILRRNQEATLRAQGGSLLLGELRLKPDIASLEAGRFVLEEMKRHLVGGISFGAGVTADDLLRFVYAFRDQDAVASTDAYANLLLRMQQRMVANIEVEVQGVERVVDLENLKTVKLQETRRNPGLLYKKALRAMDEVIDNARTGQTLRLRGAKRVVQQMIDLLSNQQVGLLGLTAMRSRDSRTQNHAVNVCILSLVMGSRLGMSKFHLCELGMAALLHDIGKAEISPEILDKPGELTPIERQTLENHPVFGVRKIMMCKGLDAMSSRIITGVFEHHLLADFSGYPRCPSKRLSLFGRIISIADSYDGLTSSRANGRTRLPPDQAVAAMLREAGKAYDQGLLKLFINCVGKYGIGSLLLLDSNELAVVVKNNPVTWENPRVRIIADSHGREVDGEAVDLAHARPHRTIAAVLSPHLFNLDVSRYFT